MEVEQQPGDWVWHPDLAEPVQIITIQHLWGKRSYRVWVPGRNRILLADEDAFTPLNRSKPLNRNEIIYRAATAKIIEIYSRERLLAPLNSRVVPLPHQIYALSRACARDPVRCLFADEVGLGKTIEAGLVVKELKLRRKASRILVVAPRGLVNQWVSEMWTHFQEEFVPIIPGTTGNQVPGGRKIWTLFDQIVVPLDAIKPMKRRRGWTPKEIHDHNQQRFHDLVNAGWDLIIIDEAHKLAGTTSQVARFKLGRALADHTHHLLLLSATPHQGKTDAFLRLMSLIDKTRFREDSPIDRDAITSSIVRTEKRNAIDAEGKPLFRPRNTRIIRVEWKEEHRLQAELYEQVTEYVRTGYNRALKEKRNYIGFLMVLMQRLVSSSTRSIRNTLEKRLSVLQDQPPPRPEEPLDEDWWDLETEERVEQMVNSSPPADPDEREEVRRLLDLARRCEATRPDAKTEEVVNLMLTLRARENNPNLKFLIFTEFVPTQTMLAEYLEARGFRVVLLNGSMSMEERQKAQTSFSRDAQVMISTEAGGEGLNLQFCHIVINYDMPWNPMRLEQRIGRVDRIGQTHDVQVYNLVFSGTVEERVHEVLLEKLLVILSDLGFDKISDVLDSSEAERTFENLFIHSIINPEKADTYLEDFIASLSERAKQERESLSFFQDDPVLDTIEVQEHLRNPLPALTEQMVANYILSRGGKVGKTISGYDLVWPDGSTQSDVFFDKSASEPSSGTLLTVSDPRVAELLTQSSIVHPEMPMKCIKIPGLPEEVSGIWSLWRLVVSGPYGVRVHAIPYFINDDGRTLRVSARQIWDTLIRGEFIETGVTSTDRSTLDRSREGAENAGREQILERTGIPEIYPVIILRVEGGNV